LFSAASVTQCAARLNLFHLVLGFRDFLRQPGDGLFERAQLPSVRQFDWLVEPTLPALIGHWSPPSSSCASKYRLLFA
jgi:hypothetical protein